MDNFRSALSNTTRFKAVYWEIGFYFSFFLITTSFITVVANMLLLLVLYKDPLKSFRTPVNNFVISLALVDLLAGVTYEPFSATCYVMVHYKIPSTKYCLYYLEEYFSAVTRVIWKISPLLIFSLTVVQLIVVASPLRLARKVSLNKIAVTTSVLWIYAITFEVIENFTRNHISSKINAVVTTIDITFHSVIIPSVTLLVYILLYREFNRLTVGRLAVRSESLEQMNRERQRIDSQERILKVNLLLIVVLLLCTIPYAGTQLAYRWFAVTAPEFQFIPIATFSLKLILHTLVFAWRLPQYRSALIVTLCQGRPRCCFPKSDIDPAQQIPMAVYQ